MQPRPLHGSTRRRRPSRATLVLAVLVGLGPGLVSAQSMRPSVSFSGFGTFGYAVLDDEAAEYRSGVALDGADENGSLELDTRLGLQLDARLTRELSGTLQVIAREGFDGEPEAGLEWGLLRYLATDSIALRVGRMSLPVFALSDFREVGYANVMLRPPEDVYSQIPLRRFDGADITYDTEIGGTLLRAQLYGGQSSEDIYDELEPDANQSVGVAFVIERGPARVRLGRVASRFRIDSGRGDITAVHEGILRASALVPSLADIADDFAPGRVALSFDSLGASYDPGPWFVDAEYARRRVDNWVADLDSWSIAAGARLGNWTPYAMASVLAEAHEDRRVTLPDDPRLDALGAGINAFYEPRDQRTVSAGLRWDVRGNIALKAQVDGVSREVTGQSLLRRAVDDGSDDGDDVVLYSAAIDFVF